MAEEVKFKGKEEKITVSPILRSVNPNIDDPDHEAFFLFGNATRDYSLPMDRQGNLINPFESDQERAWLEKTLDVDLNVYKKSDNYWHKFKVKLGKQEKKLNLKNPQDYIDYLVLKLNRQFIAPLGTKKDAYLRTQKYALLKEDDQVSEIVNKETKKIEAYKAFGKMEDDKQAMINFLKVYGQTAVNVGSKKSKVSLNTKIGLLIQLVSEIIEQDLNGFLNTVKDKENYDIKLLIANAVDTGVIIKEQRKYFLQGGDALCNEGLVPTIDNVVDYLKQIKNQDILLMLQARVDNAKE